MAKPRVPRKGKEVKETATFTNTPPVSEVHAVEVKAVEVRAVEVKEVQVELKAMAAAAAAGTESGNPEPKNAELRKTTLKPQIVKDSRATLLPINLEQEVRRLAYLFSERRGFESGHETEDWLNAEREVRQRYHQHSA